MSAAVAGGLAAGLAFNADRVAGIDAPGAIGAAAAVAGFVLVAVTTVMIWRPTEGRFVHESPGKRLISRRRGAVLVRYADCFLLVSCSSWGEPV